MRPEIARCLQALGVLTVLCWSRLGRASGVLRGKPPGPHRDRARKKGSRKGSSSSCLDRTRPWARRGCRFGTGPAVPLAAPLGAPSQAKAKAKVPMEGRSAVLAGGRRIDHCSGRRYRRLRLAWRGDPVLQRAGRHASQRQQHRATVGSGSLASRERTARYGLRTVRQSRSPQSLTLSLRDCCWSPTGVVGGSRRRQNTASSVNSICLGARQSVLLSSHVPSPDSLPRNQTAFWHMFLWQLFCLIWLAS